jgi:hypothetical protein
LLQPNIVRRRNRRSPTAERAGKSCLSSGYITTPIERKTCGKQFCLGGVCTSKERRERESRELELDTGCAALRPGHVTLTSQQDAIEEENYLTAHRNWSGWHFPGSRE